MTTDLDVFHQELFQDVQRDADAGGRFVEDAFFDLFCDNLIEAGELETADRAFYQSSRGIRIDGYGGDPAFSEGSLNLIVADFNQSPSVATLTASEIESIFKRAVAFLRKSLDPVFRNGLEETSPGFGLADLISSSWSSVLRVRLFLISNRRLSARVDALPVGVEGGIPISLSVWDIERLYRYAASGRSREDITVDMDEHGGPVPALRANLKNAGYESYVLVMPGRQLASIYDRWGARLLEQNVRVFLQARGNVNKGIRNTLENEPDMFFAYNNGLAATAEEVGEAKNTGPLHIASLRNLQIVNGGQTTASIFAALKKQTVDLSKVFVQIKLTIIDPKRAEAIVPKISEYANTQNKVNAADFFANHPYHLRIKEFSQQVYAPSTEGAFRDSKWFYERARGQYQDARGSLTVAQRKKFDLEYPRRQVFSKTDLAKYLNLWRGYPDVVSKGAQKNFAQFAAYIGKAWDRPEDFNEIYFQHAIAKAIVFRETEALVSKQPWYEGGYRANIVAYAIAKLAYDVESLGGSVNFSQIWRAQAMSMALREALTLAAERVKVVIEAPPAGTARNITEWAKQQACWHRIQQLSIPWSRSWRDELLTADEQVDIARDGVREQRLLDGIGAQLAVVKAGADTWSNLAAWAEGKRVLSEKELQIMQVAALIPTKIPSEKQSLIIIKSLKKLRDAGCAIAHEVI